MFGWRRRSEGFEWREYVRTTVLVRRADRQRRVEDVRAAAVEKVKNVADAGADAGRASASFVGSQFSRFLWFAVDVLLDLAAALFHLTIRWARFVRAVLKDAFGRISAPLTGMLRGPFDAASAKLKALPDIAQKSPVKPRHVAGALLALGLIYIGGPILRSADGVAVATVTPDTSKPVTVSTDISGRAYAISGDVLRVDGMLVHLNEVEAPELGQPCHRANGRLWKCGQAAKSGLARIVRGKTVKCTPAGQDSDGNVLATCMIGTTDIATELVQRGYVFAVRSFFGSLNDAEDQARTAKSGIWQGEIQRPQEWRDQQWEDAKRDAPDGCPIKGLIRASSKLYALPWSQGYDRAKVHTKKGERWFCSEDEAKAAGFASWSRS
jgi:endonuclease YncB( thermonuclease family)